MTSSRKPVVDDVGGLEVPNLGGADLGRLLLLECVSEGFLRQEPVRGLAYGLADRSDTLLQIGLRQHLGSAILDLNNEDWPNDGIFARGATGVVTLVPGRVPTSLDRRGLWTVGPGMTGLHR